MAKKPNKKTAKSEKKNPAPSARPRAASRGTGNGSSMDVLNGPMKATFRTAFLKKSR